MASSETLRERCLSNLSRVRESVAEACRRAGRPPADVTLVGVTKYVDATAARCLLEAGCADLAESRPQELWAKAAALADARPEPRWHLVGHLQRNKVRRTLPVGALIHTLDSRRLLEALEAEAAAADTACEVLVEVNVSGDPARSGAMEADAEPLLVAAAQSPHLRLRGLMAMASHPDGPAADARRDFARLRELRDRITARGIVDAALVRELSMGMSGDFAEAILEGSTMVRIGSALFAGLVP
ncbi:MAG: YggS family pyridoxal phosphate-dependent enzyme [Planctomycetia bacterium]|nr:YggS family pyridoxal phosphate-dependent enzyme [Planctomycetia bacterium]